MYKYSKDGISVLSVLDARRAKKSGLFPVKIQVIHNRRQKYYSTGQELSKEDWANLAESKSRRLTEARSNIENSFSIIKGQVEGLTAPFGGASVSIHPREPPVNSIFRFFRLSFLNLTFSLEISLNLTFS